jgi:hypothetical protein
VQFSLLRVNCVPTPSFLYKISIKVICNHCLKITSCSDLGFTGQKYDITQYSDIRSNYMDVGTLILFLDKTRKFENYFFPFPVELRSMQLLANTATVAFQRFKVIDQPTTSLYVFLFSEASHGQLDDLRPGTPYTHLVYFCPGRCLAGIHYCDNFVICFFQFYNRLFPLMYRTLVNFFDLDLNGNLGERDVGITVRAEEILHENLILLL